MHGKNCHAANSEADSSRNMLQVAGLMTEQNGKLMLIGGKMWHSVIWSGWEGAFVHFLWSHRRCSNHAHVKTLHQSGSNALCALHQSASCRTGCWRIQRLWKFQQQKVLRLWTHGSRRIPLWVFNKEVFQPISVESSRLPAFEVVSVECKREHV